MTQTGAVIGTPFYMSPEQVKGEPVGPQSDIFALGVILYQMAAGTVPFGGATPFEVMISRIQRPPKPVRELNPELPVYLQKIIERCLTVDLGLRYQNVQQILDDLDAQSVKTTIVHRTRSQRWLRPAAAIVVLAALLAAGGLWLYQKGRGAKPDGPEDPVGARRRLRQPRRRRRLRRNARAGLHDRARGRVLRELLQPERSAQGRVDLELIERVRMLRVRLDQLVLVIAEVAVLVGSPQAHPVLRDARRREARSPGRQRLRNAQIDRVPTLRQDCRVVVDDVFEDLIQLLRARRRPVKIQQLSPKQLRAVVDAQEGIVDRLEQPERMVESLVVVRAP